ncbi:MAG: Fic family protein [Balneola sp.]|nr:MAG: Fic family protein [Balneola sp.]
MKPFIPHNLPNEDLNWKPFRSQLGPANRSIARFDGLLQSIPNPAVLLSPLTTKEAVLSSKIEGTQATLEEVLKYEADPKQKTENYQDIREIINYRKAINFAVEELKERPITLRLLKEMHSMLLDSVRGKNKGPGQFRSTQNWIGKPGTKIEEARFVPPSPLILQDGLNNFEKYLNFNDEDTLVQVAIAHAQFEILHPFLDGNGRIGRIFIPLFLFSKGVLHTPMFYISGFLESNRDEYYDRLKAISDNNDWENWIIFFLKAIEHQSIENTEKAKKVLSLYDEMKTKIVDITRSQFALQALDTLFNMPIFSSTDFQKNSSIPKPSAIRILNSLKEANVISLFIEGKGNRPSIYVFFSLLDIVNE